METKSVNFNAIKLTGAEVLGIYHARFSYGSDIPILPEWQTNTECYSKVIRYLENEGKISQFNTIVKKLLRSFIEESKKLRLPISQWGKSDSWVQWDMAKTKQL